MDRRLPQKCITLFSPTSLEYHHESAAHEQFLHLFSLNEIVDVSKIYAAELSRVRGVLRADGGENHHTRLKTASLRRQKFRALRTEP